MILSLAKSFFQFRLTEKTILESLPSVVTIPSFCHCCDLSILHMAQSLSSISILILVIHFTFLERFCHYSRAYQIHGSRPSSVALPPTKLPLTMVHISIGPAKKAWLTTEHQLQVVHINNPHAPFVLFELSLRSFDPSSSFFHSMAPLGPLYLGQTIMTTMITSVSSALKLEK